MIKRTIYFSRPCSLKKKDMQMQAEFEDDDGDGKISIPIEDIGILILDNPCIILSNALITALNDNNTAVISCDESHLPFGFMLPFYSHHAFTEKLSFQIESSMPLKKNLWQQTVVAKIENQASHLERRGLNNGKLKFHARQVKSGDTTNVEGRASAFYWDSLFGDTGFVRHRYGGPPNNMLNYGYAILRSVVARSLVISGMLPAIGIHHRNKYNPYCLADDIMEPYRPYVDSHVIDIVEVYGLPGEVTPVIKKELLKLPSIDVTIEGKTGPLMVAMQRTTASLAACFEGVSRKILYPEF